MNFELKFNCDNAAFHAAECETIRILEDICNAIHLGCVESNIRDINGNTIGKWEFTNFND